jgi:hypothetical protein
MNTSFPVHPTQLYESLVGLTLLGLLLWQRKYTRFRGQVFFLFVFAYGFFRFLLELWRDDVERGSYGTQRRSSRPSARAAERLPRPNKGRPRRARGTPADDAVCRRTDEALSRKALPEGSDGARNPMMPPPPCTGGRVVRLAGLARRSHASLEPGGPW